MPSTPLKEIQARIEALQSGLRELDLDAAFIIQKVDLFYFAGTGQDAVLFVPADGDPILLVRKSFERAREDTPLGNVVQVKNLREMKAAVSGSGPLNRLGLELDILPVNYFRLYKGLFEGAGFQDVSPLIRTLRMCKSAYELEYIHAAARFNDSMFAHVPHFLREGMSELELAGLVEAYYRKYGHQGLVRVRTFNAEVFYGHIMAGPSLALPSSSVGPTGGRGPNPSLPQGASPALIKRGEPIQIDYVAIVNGYIVDQARTYYLGDPPDKFVRAHETALQIQRAIVENGKVGTPMTSLYSLALEMAHEAGLADGFMGYPDPVPFVGHGIGLELDELPVMGKKSPHVLEEGMVIAIEPKFIFPGAGLAGIENSFVVTTAGLEKITLFPDEIYVVP